MASESCGTVTRSLWLHLHSTVLANTKYCRQATESQPAVAAEQFCTVPQDQSPGVEWPPAVQQSSFGSTLLRCPSVTWATRGRRSFQSSHATAAPGLQSDTHTQTTSTNNHWQQFGLKQMPEAPRIEILPPGVTAHHRVTTKDVTTMTTTT